MLIVNNKLDPVAKLAWGGEIEQQITSFVSYSWGNFSRDRHKREETKTTKVVYEMELGIVWPESMQPIFDRWIELVKRDTKALKAKKASQSKGSVGYPAYQGNLWPRQSHMDDSYWDSKKGEWVDVAKAEDDASLIQMSSKKFDGAVWDKDLLMWVKKKEEVDLLDDDKQMDLIMGAIIMGDETYAHGVDDAFLTLTKHYIAESANMSKEEYADFVEKDIIDILNQGADVVAECMGEMWIDDATYKQILDVLRNRIDKYSGVTPETFKTVIDAW